MSYLWRGRNISYRRLAAQFGRDLVEPVQLRDRFDVEAQDVMLKRQPHFVARFADAGKDHLARVAAGRNYPTRLDLFDDGILANDPKDDVSAPPDTMSKPEPMPASKLSTARLELDFTE